ncbi:hypothetical protein WKI68_11455 [Streptomyces sp. MS1.HAVA.3]|uniref:Uncharacterized protein n=1 Tax=Streptomyces caledonius TaxID=3134107 RepID=A0ABU8U2L6_9ACTN
MTQGSSRTTPHLTLSNQEFSVLKHRAVRSSLLASAVAVTLLATAGQATTQAAETAAPAAFTGARTAAPAAAAHGPTGNPFDEVDRFADAKDNTPAPAPAPGGQALAGQVPARRRPTPRPPRTSRSAARRPRRPPPRRASPQASPAPSTGSRTSVRSSSPTSSPTRPSSPTAVCAASSGPGTPA